MLGIIGEDATDCDAIGAILRRIVGHGVGIRTAYPSSGGCGQMRRKASAFMQRLVRNGCTKLIIVHDCDRNDPKQLRSTLEAISRPPGARHHICIPVEELEAWFWSDQNVLDMVGKPGSAKALTSPERLQSPKEKLEDLSRKAHGKTVYSTNENEKLAKALNLDVCAANCPSFKALKEFIESAIGL